MSDEPDGLQWMGMMFVVAVLLFFGSCCMNMHWAEWCQKGKPWADGKNVYHCVQEVR